MVKLGVRSVFLIVLSSPVALHASPQLRLSAPSLTVYVESGVNAPSQTVNAFNLGDGALNLAVVSTTASWLSAAVGFSTTCSGGPVSICIPITVSFNTSGLAIGNYSASFTVNDPNSIDSPQTVTVSLQVNGSPPTVTLYVAPNNGASTTQSDAASLTVNTGSAVIASITTSSGGPWLTFTSSGTHIVYNSYLLRVTAQPGQAASTYAGTVVLSGSSNAPDDHSINVSMVVTTQPIIQFPSTPITFNLVQGQAPQTYNLNLQNLGSGSLSISGASTSGINGLNASANGAASVSITADPTQLAPGSYSGTVTLSSNAANTAIPFAVQVNVTAAGGPTAYFGGVVDNAAFSSGQAVAAGSIAAVFGSQFSSSAPSSASGFPLATHLGGVQVMVNGVPAPLFYASANQVDFQVPSALASGQALVQVVNNGTAGNRVSVTVTSIAPRLFIIGQTAPDGGQYGAIFNSDNTLALPTNLVSGSHPAHLGDVLTIYALGLGPVSPSIADGEPASNSPASKTANPVQVTYGGGGPGSVSSTAIYAGLAPFFAGLYQINALLPQGAPTGNVPVAISESGQGSNIVEMVVAAQ